VAHDTVRSPYNPSSRRVNERERHCPRNGLIPDRNIYFLGPNSRARIKSESLLPLDRS
jgi:hypothetical protein